MALVLFDRRATGPDGLEDARGARGAPADAKEGDRFVAGLGLAPGRVAVGGPAEGEVDRAARGDGKGARAEDRAELDPRMIHDPDRAACLRAVGGEAEVERRGRHFGHREVAELFHRRGRVGERDRVADVEGERGVGVSVGGSDEPVDPHLPSPGLADDDVRVAERGANEVEGADVGVARRRARRAGRWPR